MMGCEESCKQLKPFAPLTTIMINSKGQVSKQCRTDSNGKQLTSSRWSPTPEQLFSLEELYRRGTRTPTAQQIQQIANHLRQFGKIEGKNVFYWFQNHKARERQKQFPEFKSGLRKTSHEVQQTKMLRPIKNNINRLPDQDFQGNSLSTPTGQVTKRIRDGLSHLKGEDLLMRSRGKSQCTWQTMGMSISPPVFLIPKTITNLEGKNKEIQTLELFPLKSNSPNCKGVGVAKDTELVTEAMETNFSEDSSLSFFL